MIILSPKEKLRVYIYLFNNFLLRYNNNFNAKKILDISRLGNLIDLLDSIGVLVLDIYKQLLKSKSQFTSNNVYINSKIISELFIIKNNIYTYYLKISTSTNKLGQEIKLVLFNSIANYSYRPVSLVNLSMPST